MCFLGFQLSIHFFSRDFFWLFFLCFFFIPSVIVGLVFDEKNWSLTVTPGGTVGARVGFT